MNEKTKKQKDRKLGWVLLAAFFILLMIGVHGFLMLVLLLVALNKLIYPGKTHKSFKLTK